MTSSHVGLSLATLRLLLDTNCILREWFLQNLPKVKEELGMVTYYKLVEMAVETLPETDRATFLAGAQEGKQAQVAGQDYQTNPHNPIREGYGNAGWAFGWIRSKHKQM